ncbi:hypothetical protein ACQPW3_19705 [Actinosynnema sp. CA-248983]
MTALTNGVPDVPADPGAAKAAAEAYAARIAADRAREERREWRDSGRSLSARRAARRVGAVRGARQRRGRHDHPTGQRPFAADDVSLVADVSITYLVLRVVDNQLVAAGTATLTGKIGEQLVVTP